MYLRRILVVLVVLVGLAGLVWAATVRFTVPAAGEGEGDSPAAKAARFELELAEPAPAPPSAIDYRRIDRRLTELMEEPAMVGLAVAIVEDGEIRFLKGYGETLAGSGDPVTPDTVFRWASLSKGVAGDMVALLAERRELSLFDPVGRHAASLRLPGGNEARATVSDLLTHRLGLFGHAYDSKLEDGEDPRVLRGRLATLDGICAPGQCHAYQNVAFDAASEIVERLTGQPYHEAVHDMLFRPLGMGSASMSREGLTAAPSWARPHPGGRNGRAVEISDSYYRVPAAGGVNGSIKDLAIWMMAQMGLAPDVLPPEVLAAVQTARAATPSEDARRRKYRERIGSTAYGLGWRVFDYAGHKAVGHHGGVRGYRALILFDPERRTGVAALWNSGTGRPIGLEYEVMDMAYRLPFRDWLGLGEGGDDSETPSPDNQGGP